MKGESLKTWFFRQGMNVYPMFFGTGGRVEFLSRDWKQVRVRLKLGLWTYNYAGTIFGGSMFSAIDPFYMVLLVNILGRDYIVWDKAGTIAFKKPGRSKITANISYTDEDIKTILENVSRDGRYQFDKSVDWTDQDGHVISTVTKTVYVATKAHYKKRQLERALKKT